MTSKCLRNFRSSQRCRDVLNASSVASTGRMRPGALEASSQILKIAPAASRASGCALLIRLRGPLKWPSCRLKWQPRPWIYSDTRSFASIHRRSSSEGNDHTYLRRKTPTIEQDDLKAPKIGETDAWVALLDQYLPQSLRIPAQRTDDTPETTDQVSIVTVPLLLDRARYAAKVDLLCYIGVYQERWEAVYWLVTAMLAKCPSFVEMKRHSQRLPTVLWDTNGPGLDEITRLRPHIETPRKSKTPLNSLVSDNLMTAQLMTVEGVRQLLGAIWQSLGSMLLEIEDRSSENPNRPLILSHVLHILAHMHHNDVLPDTMYNYDLITGSTSAPQRPPMIYLLSARIFAVLSDISWKTYWAHEMEKGESKGHKLELPRVQPQMPRVGPEVWLELVLWACVEGGWISEAAWIVNEIQKRRDIPERRWSVISWDEISSRKIPELGIISGIKREIDRSRLNQATGIGIANRSASNANLDMGIRTISREVVVAIADGLANIVTDDSLPGNTVAKRHQCLLSCQKLLERRHLGMDARHLNTLTLRTIETSAMNAGFHPSELQLLLSLKHADAQASANNTSPTKPVVKKDIADNAAPLLGLLHRLLDCYAREGNLVGSLQSLKLIQIAVDGNRDIYIQDFAEELRRRLRPQEGPNESDDSKNSKLQQSLPLMLHSEIPPYVLEPFLDLLAESKAFKLGRWVLFNDDIDGGILSPDAFSDPAIQPALLRFATATASDDLLMKVLEKLEQPLSEPVLHALLRCQAVVNRWDGVEGILKHLRVTHSMAWTSFDAMSIAAAILDLESKGSNISHLSQAKGILQALVQGDFHTIQSRAQIPDLQQMRTANQIGRIFQSVAGGLSAIKLGQTGYLGRANYSVMIPSEAFNILLASVIQGHGSLAGIELWERWCLEPEPELLDSNRAVIFNDDDGSERIVKPTVSMLRLILLPAIEAMKDPVHSSIAKLRSGTDDQSQLDSAQHNGIVEHSIASGRIRASLTTSRESLSVFDWCINMYRRLGSSESEILGEIPPAFGQIMAQKRQDLSLTRPASLLEL